MRTRVSARGRARSNGGGMVRCGSRRAGESWDRWGPSAVVVVALALGACVSESNDANPKRPGAEPNTPVAPAPAEPTPTRPAAPDAAPVSRGSAPAVTAPADAGISEQQPRTRRRTGAISCG